MKINILGTEYTVEERNKQTDIQIIQPKSVLLMIWKKQNRKAGPIKNSNFIRSP